VKQRILKVHKADNVMVALQNLQKGETIHYLGKDYLLAADISAKHKFFEHDMPPGEKVIMYGALVGTAQQFIPAGGLMTTGNIKHASGRLYTGPATANGHPRTSANLPVALSMATTAAMVAWEPPITGCLFPPFSA
jgi:hypothetical protein